MTLLAITFFDICRLTVSNATPPPIIETTVHGHAKLTTVRVEGVIHLRHGLGAGLLGCLRNQTLEPSPARIQKFMVSGAAAAARLRRCQYVRGPAAQKDPDRGGEGDIDDAIRDHWHGRRELGGGSHIAEVTWRLGNSERAADSGALNLDAEGVATDYREAEQRRREYGASQRRRLGHDELRQQPPGRRRERRRRLPLHDPLVQAARGYDWTWPNGQSGGSLGVHEAQLWATKAQQMFDGDLVDYGRPHVREESQPEHVRDDDAELGLGPRTARGNHRGWSDPWARLTAWDESAGANMAARSRCVGSEDKRDKEADNASGGHNTARRRTIQRLMNGAGVAVSHELWPPHGCDQRPNDRQARDLRDDGEDRGRRRLRYQYTSHVAPAASAQLHRPCEPSRVAGLLGPDAVGVGGPFLWAFEGRQGSWKPLAECCGRGTGDLGWGRRNR